MKNRGKVVGQRSAQMLLISFSFSLIWTFLKIDSSTDISAIPGHGSWIGLSVIFWFMLLLTTSVIFLIICRTNPYNIYWQKDYVFPDASNQSVHWECYNFLQRTSRFHRWPWFVMLSTKARGECQTFYCYTLYRTSHVTFPVSSVRQSLSTNLSYHEDRIQQILTILKKGLFHFFFLFPSFFSFLKCFRLHLINDKWCF